MKGGIYRTEKAIKLVKIIINYEILDKKERGKVGSNLLWDHFMGKQVEKPQFIIKSDDFKGWLKGLVEGEK